MKSFELIINLYHLLISEDDHVSEKEVEIATQIASIEGISMQFFNDHLKTLQSYDRDKLYKETVEELKKRSMQLRIRFIAWLSIIANADGFMDKREWAFIYKLYHTDLQLDLNLIMKEQKELKQKIN